ncbi:Methylmalonyl-CoA mutase small subunit, MutA [hydrothermal vent metagenome]|uniref:Methylmalonyl-CoA mutase small subunit, MutA n=1 Tax=hydrothermal vent metagenome TaxID=652676 RepID=A0A3B0TBL4_9ZZZZ
MSDRPTKAQTESSGFAAFSRADWLAQAARSLNGRPVSDLATLTADGIKIEALNAPAPKPAAIPGMRPSPPEVMPLVIETDPATANGAILAELEGGAAGVVVQMAAPGQPGLALAPDALQTALAGVQLDAARLTLAPGGGNWPQALEGFAMLTRGPGAPLCGLSLGADPIGAAMNSDHGIPPADIAILAEFAGTLAKGPEVRLFSASGVPAHEAGATEAQELAAMLASGVAYLRGLDAAGHPPRAAAKRIGLELSTDTEVFVTIAKFRAARLLWARVLELSGAEVRPRLAARSSARMMTAADAHVNMLRTSAAALAAALGGADSLTVLPFTHLLGRPDGQARRIARNTMIILTGEAYVGMVADPASGSGFAEHLTQGLAGKAWTLFGEIEAAGGAASPGGAGLLRDAVRKARHTREAQIASGARVIMGQNAYLNAKDQPPEVEPWPA